MGLPEEAIEPHYATLEGPWLPSLHRVGPTLIQKEPDDPVSQGQKQKTLGVLLKLLLSSIEYQVADFHIILRGSSCEPTMDCMES